MFITRMPCLLLLVGCGACAPLLDADFDSLPQDLLTDETVDLPGPPEGDRMLVQKSVSVGDPTGSGDHTLSIFRNALANQTANHSEAYFDPIAAPDAESIFFSWNGTVFDLPVSGGDAPVVALKLRDLTDSGQPNLFSKLIIRYGPEKITTTLPPADEVSIGNGVTGSHKVVLRIDPGPKTYSFFIGGEGVSPDDGFTHDGTLSPDVAVDPENIGLTITFADEINAGGSTYVINNMLISQREP